MASEADNVLKLWVVMNHAFQSIEGPLRQQVEARGLSFTEFAVLEALFHQGALPIGEIGNRILRTSGSMTYVVDKLEKRGLLRRRACDTDRRIIFIDLTEPGRMLIASVFDEHRSLLVALMRGLLPEEQRRATDLLKRLGLYAKSHTAPVV